MIINGLFDFIFGLANVLFEFLPSVEIGFGTGFNTFLSIVSSVAYLLPMNTILIMFGIIISLMIFRIIVSVIKTIWQLLPIL
ncbi:hypothetical protein SAMN02746066_00978 [Anaerosporobacter mobilis DSM 15930]|jgi:hypothetical protein|uniref:Uncharacterized protein n=1 Tax=Anaerosporobacter mobilis DSM 15930 TaxID=1120996 RepID=A0A1M7GKQ9_9FIRM|nr:hypothetical protein [Anaerosporobacter mobilis]SHM16801.1 hypothetical protein SAMN02746066_00978 [Anaerosporobacter mobilis DSM 15930]